MTMRIFLAAALIVAAAAVGLCSADAVHRQQVVGGWSPIKDINDPHIQELGGWAVSEHVKQAHDGLVFTKVVSGREQVVAGMKYDLAVVVSNSDGKSAKYGALVHEEMFNKKRELLAFRPAN
ncbi:hypothetical protein ACP4OV_021141 [Aristida adscensionis]